MNAINKPARCDFIPHSSPPAHPPELWERQLRAVAWDEGASEFIVTGFRERSLLCDVEDRRRFAEG